MPRPGKYESLKHQPEIVLHILPTEVYGELPQLNHDHDGN
jgi:hypothetical protein